MSSSSLTLQIASRRWWLIALLSAVIAVIAIAVESSYLQTMSRHGTGVFAWELARSSGRAESALSQWGPAGRSAAKTASWIDFAFILGYSGLLFSVGRALGARAALRGAPGLESLAAGVAALGISAGLANVVAKIIQLLILGSHTSQPLPALGFAAALLNYALLAAAILAGAVLLVRSRRLAARPGQPTKPGRRFAPSSRAERARAERAGTK